MKLTITLPLPPKEVQANFRSRSHWPKANAVKEYRQDAYYCALEDKNGLVFRESAPWASALITPTFYKVNRRGQLDHDNAIHSLKAAVDALCDAGIIANDRGVRWGEVKQLIDKKHPRVELEVEEL